MFWTKLGVVVRLFLRYLAGFTFWLHALLIIPVAHPSFSRLGDFVGFNIPETILSTFFVALSVLAGYGLRRFLVDVLFVYAFPFVLAYNVAKYASKLVGRLTRVASALLNKPAPPLPFSWGVLLTQCTPAGTVFTLKSIVNKNDDLILPDMQKADIVDKTHTDRWAWMRLALPFKSFTIAWSSNFVKHKATFDSTQYVSSSGSYSSVCLQPSQQNGKGTIISEWN